jgi:translin
MNRFVSSSRLNYESMESSLREASKKLDLVSSRRERLIKESRDIISLSSKAIISIHTLNFQEAHRFSKDARDKLEDLRDVAGSDLTRYIIMPEQEYVESSTMIAVSDKKPIPSLKKLGVTPASYILGLLDTIGELKRSIYDDIRRDQIARAEERFAIMESIYTMLSPFAVYDNIVQGVRRKLDVARMLIEDTRAAITEEVRRDEFMLAVTNLSTKLGAAPPILSPIKRREVHALNENIEANENEGRRNEDDQ